MAKDLVEALDRLNGDTSSEAVAGQQLSYDSCRRLLSWYNGNPFDFQESSLRHALKVLKWCEQSSDIFEYPGDMRLAKLDAGSKALGISEDRLANLLANSGNLLVEPNSTARLIAFEGIDTNQIARQIDLLQTFLIRRTVRVTSISGPDPEKFFSREIARLEFGKDVPGERRLDPKSMAVWYALERKMSVSQIRRQPTDSFVLISRYTLSSIVREWVRSGVDLADWIFQLEHTFLSIPAPDLYIVLDVPPSFAEANPGVQVDLEARITVHRASSMFLAAARRRYCELANRFPQIQLINCTMDGEKMRTPEQIHAEVLSCLNRIQFLPTAA